MKFRSFLLPFLFVKNTTSEMIRNKNVPSCMNCKFSQNTLLTGSTTFIRCRKFGEKDIVTDKLSYDFADSCRNDEKRCGIEGKYYEEDKFPFIKKLNSTTLFASFFSFYIFCLLILSNKIK
jgi:hypothetical protein